MRDLTTAEWDALAHDRCPFCGRSNFIEGPHGGLSVNIFCAHPPCEAGFNVSPIPGWGQVIREPHPGQRPPETFECYAWIGEDEFGSGVVGIKGAYVAAGYVPLVSIDRYKLETEDIVEQMQAVVNSSGKPRLLVRLVMIEEVKSVRAERQ